MDVKPHAYDPAAQPELFEGVLSRRIVAFIIDVIIISIPVASRLHLYRRARHHYLRAWLAAVLAGVSGSAWCGRCSITA